MVPHNRRKCCKQSQWSGLQTIIKVVRTRHLWNKTTQEVMFYLSSLPADAQKIGLAIRQHWSIENQLHWVLDQALMRMRQASVKITPQRIWSSQCLPKMSKNNLTNLFYDALKT
ncbi:MAG: ISAs1 family transposase [Nostoc indistinguendum CM1-VF10]|nr:ISAs1 family transposase [Nostoc indistinguendum CM1-VF10]